MPPRAPGDHYSELAAGYAVFRPRYPAELFEFVASIAPSLRLAWDCGAGNGQATTGLADYFDRVIATDVSAEQIAQAPRHPRIEWQVAPAEDVPMIGSRSIDLVTVAQALHWFDHERFYAEVRRVAVPNGAIAAWTYAAPTMDGDVGALLSRYMHEDMEPYWPPERRYVDSKYSTIPFPFERIAAPVLRIECDWTREQLVGYMRTMSATLRYIKANGNDPIVVVERELAALWKGSEPRRIVWPVIVLAGRIS